METEPYLREPAGGRQVPVVFVDPAAGVESVVCRGDNYSEQEADQGYVSGYRCDLSARIFRRGESWVVQAVEQSFMGRSPTHRGLREFESTDGGRTWTQIR